MSKGNLSAICCLLLQRLCIGEQKGGCKSTWTAQAPLCCTKRALRGCRSDWGWVKGVEASQSLVRWVQAITTPTSGHWWFKRQLHNVKLDAAPALSPQPWPSHTRHSSKCRNLGLVMFDELGLKLVGWLARGAVKQSFCWGHIEIYGSESVEINQGRIKTVAWPVHGSARCPKSWAECPLRQSLLRQLLIKIWHSQA